MRWPVLRTLLVLLLSLGVTAPLAGAAMAGLGPDGIRTVTICTGDGLRTLTLDGAGKPVTISDASHPCALVHVTTPVAQPGPPGHLAAAEPAPLLVLLPGSPCPASNPARARLIRAPPAA